MNPENTIRAHTYTKNLLKQHTAFIDSFLEAVSVKTILAGSISFHGYTTDIDLSTNEVQIIGPDGRPAYLLRNLDDPTHLTGILVTKYFPYRSDGKDYYTHINHTECSWQYNYTGQEKEGLFCLFYYSGCIQYYAHYENGEEIGRVEWFFDKNPAWPVVKSFQSRFGFGNIKTRYHVNKDGKLNGRYEEWFENGRLSYSIDFKAGIADGMVETWLDENHTEVTIGRYTNGVRTAVNTGVCTSKLASKLAAKRAAKRQYLRVEAEEKEKEEATSPSPEEDRRPGDRHTSLDSRVLHYCLDVLNLGD